MKKRFLLLTLIATTLASFAQTKKPITKKATTAKEKPAASKYGALAIDRSNGFYYGWSFDYATLSEAEQKAIEECKAKGGNCTVVLSYSGTGCAAYRTIDGSVGTAFGWGLAKTKEEADRIATQECLKRSSGINPQNFVWSCNSANTGVLKEIYNASGEIEAPVKVGNQIWSNKNLNVSVFRNGEPIPEAKNATEWQQFCKTDKPAFCYLNFDPKNGKKYGKLYNFHAVIDSRGLAPKGWHVPSKREFETLISYLGGEYEAGKKMRAIKGWDVPDKKYGEFSGNGTNSSGLNFLPGSRAWSNEYDKEPEKATTVFGEYYSDGEWWSSTIDGSARWNDNGGQYGYYNNGFSLGFSDRKKNYTGVGSESPQRGFSVRVLKD